MKYNDNIRLDNPKMMACFKDGTRYIIRGNVVEYKDGDISEEDLMYFANKIKEFDSIYKFELVYSEKFKYYFVALLGYDDQEFEFDEKLDKEFENMTNYLKTNEIEFY